MKKNFLLFFLFYSINLTAGTHTVTNTSDSGPGSLRQAIIDANSDSTTPRNIVFNIPGTGPHTISPVTELPHIVSDQIIIDGTSQPGWSEGNPVIVLDGSNSSFNFSGLTINSSSNSIIQDLVINNGFNSGISILGTSNGNSILGCFIGTDYTGTNSLPNNIGIYCYSHFGQHNDITIGSASKGNVISGNNYFGIVLSGGMDNILVQSNIIGLASNEIDPLPNNSASIGIVYAYSPNDSMCKNLIIGGPSSSLGNKIFSGAIGTILLSLQPFDSVTIQYNMFGAYGTFRPNTYGISIFHQSGSLDDLTVLDNSIM